MTTVDTRVSLVIQPCFFGREEWEFQGEIGKDLSVKGIPGTWTPRKDFMPLPWLAILCCPSCGGNSVLHSSIHTISHIGKVRPSFICKYVRAGHSCSFHRDVYLDKWNNKRLYACALELVDLKGQILKKEMRYVHADTQNEARMQLGNTKPFNRVAAIGPVISYFIEDKKGEKLSVD